MSFNNAQFIELIEKFLEDIRPTSPITVGSSRRYDKRSERTIEYLYLEVDVERGPKTQVQFKKSEIASRGEAQIAAFLIDKLSSIGVDHAARSERGTNNIGETAAEFDGSITPAETAKLHEMLGSKNIQAPGQAEAQAKVESQLKVDPANVTEEELDIINQITDTH